MKRFFFNITGGKPKLLLRPCLISLCAGLCQLVPTLLIFAVFYAIYLASAKGETLPMDQLSKFFSKVQYQLGNAL